MLTYHIVLILISIYLQTVVLTAAVSAVGDSDGRHLPSTAETEVPPWSVLFSRVGTTACSDAATGEVVRVPVTVYSPPGDAFV